MNFAWLYVGLLYAIAIALARRISWRIAILFYLIVLLLLFRPLTGPYVNVAADIVDMIPPWSAYEHHTKFDVSNLEIHDATMQIVPWAHQVREAWRSGSIPLWNALSGCGYPLLANGQSSALAPVRLLALPLPLAQAIGAEAAMKLLMALTFTFLYLRHRGFSEMASLAGSISFGVSTFIIGWLHYPLVTVAVFLPAILYAIDLIAERVSPARIAFAAIASALMVFGGHIETVVHIALLTAVYVFWIAFIERAVDRRHFLGALAIAVIAAALLAAPFLAPFAEAVPRSLRVAQLETKEFGGVAYSDLSALMLLLQPRFFGGRPLPWGPMTCESFTGFAGILGLAGAVACVARAAITRNWRDRTLSFVAVALIAFSVVANWPIFTKPIHALLPYVAHGRLRLLLCFCGAMFTAALIDMVGQRAAVLIGVCVAAASLGWLLLGWSYSDNARWFASMREAIPSLIVLALAAMLPLSRWRMFVTPLLALAILAELAIVSRGWNPIFPASALYPRTPLIDALSKLDRDGSRIVGIGEPLFPNTQAIFGFADVRVHDPMANARYTSFLERTIKGYDTKDYYTKWYDADTPLLDVLNVRWVLTASGAALSDTARYRLVYDGKDGRIYENRHVRPPLLAIDGNSLRMRYDTRQPTLIATSIAWWPGWRIKASGKSLRPEIVSEAFLGFTVPAGRGEVVLRYVPATFWIGVVVSILTLIALAAAMLKVKHVRTAR